MQWAEATWKTLSQWSAASYLRLPPLWLTHRGRWGDHSLIRQWAEPPKPTAPTKDTRGRHTIATVAHHWDRTTATANQGQMFWKLIQSSRLLIWLIPKHHHVLRGRHTKQNCSWNVLPQNTKTTKYINFNHRRPTTYLPSFFYTQKYTNVLLKTNLFFTSLRKHYNTSKKPANFHWIELFKHRPLCFCIASSQTAPSWNQFLSRRHHLFWQ